MVGSFFLSPKAPISAELGPVRIGCVFRGARGTGKSVCEVRVVRLLFRREKERPLLLTAWFCLQRQPHVCCSLSLTNTQVLRKQVHRATEYFHTKSGTSTRSLARCVSFSLNQPPPLPKAGRAAIQFSCSPVYLEVAGCIYFDASPASSRPHPWLPALSNCCRGNPPDEVCCISLWSDAPHRTKF